MDHAMAMTIHPSVDGCALRTSEATDIRFKANIVLEILFLKGHSANLNFEIRAYLAEAAEFGKHFRLIGFGQHQLIVTVKQKDGEKYSINPYVARVFTPEVL